MSATGTDRLFQLEQRIHNSYTTDEDICIKQLIDSLALSSSKRHSISQAAAKLVTEVRGNSRPSLMENFLAEYGLSTKEGIALMCMAEALLRIPDKTTITKLITDKIEPGDWASHLGQSSSHFINSSTWALLFTGKLLRPTALEPRLAALTTNNTTARTVTQQITNTIDIGTTIKAMLKRLGEPVIRKAVTQAMKELGAQFVLGQDINDAINNSQPMLAKGYTYSYDMLGEAARTQADADNYFKAYSDAIANLSPHCNTTDVANNPGISIKLSALHPRYEWGQKQRVMTELLPRVLKLAQQAKAAHMGFNIDAEEADRLIISLDIIAALLQHPSLSNWNGFGVVVQAYSKRATHVLDWLFQLVIKADQHIMVRLVKGAYWDTEIKRAQVLGLEDYPVFTRKANTDIAYLACAKQLLSMHQRIYAQFATHNAHTVAAIQYFADNLRSKSKHPINFEFQRLHGMGESLHQHVMQHTGDDNSKRCRIYAPVGAHQDLLAYLVRRLLENGANSSFVHQLANPDISPMVIARDPLGLIEDYQQKKQTLRSHHIIKPAALFGKYRTNAKGWDVTDVSTMQQLSIARQHWQLHQWHAKPLLALDTDTYTDNYTDGGAEARTVLNPANSGDKVGWVKDANQAIIDQALSNIRNGQEQWLAMPLQKRQQCFLKLADLYEHHADELFCLLCREAGKTWQDAIGELREAIDFARYYQGQMQQMQAIATDDQTPRTIVCISPWNFPLAIFTGQIMASLAAGNSVLAKPASQTCLIAYRAVQLMHQAGIPTATLQFLPGDGHHIGNALVSNSKISGVCFTGSTNTAYHINQQMAQHLPVSAPLIAETGGLNAMLVDSTALPEQVVQDVIASAFQSAGQRCSALRMLYLQEDVAEHIITMLCGAMDELQVGNPNNIDVDVGPVIDQLAKDKIQAYIKTCAHAGQVIKQTSMTVAENTTSELFIAPTLIRIDGIEQLKEEIFGPVLHVATYRNNELDTLIEKINATGYGLTFGIHTRIDSRVEKLVNTVNAGNIYVNRNQIGAVVGSQPFGGEGLSGTGPKAGGPNYVQRLCLPELLPQANVKVQHNHPVLTLDSVQTAINQLLSQNNHLWRKQSQRISHLDKVFGTPNQTIEDLCQEKYYLPGPTGELNQLDILPRGLILCLGLDKATALAQTRTALAQGNSVIIVNEAITLPQHNLPLITVSGYLPAHLLTKLDGIAAVACHGDPNYLRQLRFAMAKRTGPIIPLITHEHSAQHYIKERHLCIDTTAAGGNASLIATEN